MAQAQSPCLQNGNDWLLLHADRQTVPNHEGSDGDTAQCLGLTLHPIGARRGSERGWERQGKGLFPCRAVTPVLSCWWGWGSRSRDDSLKPSALIRARARKEARGRGREEAKTHLLVFGRREGVYVISKLPPCLPSLGSWEQPLHEASLGLYARHKTAPASVSPLRHCVSFSSFLSSSIGSQGW